MGFLFGGPQRNGYPIQPYHYPYPEYPNPTQIPNHMHYSFYPQMQQSTLSKHQPLPNPDPQPYQYDHGNYGYQHPNWSYYQYNPYQQAHLPYRPFIYHEQSQRNRKETNTDEYKDSE